MTLFGNRVFVNIIRLRGDHTGLEWALNPVAGVIMRRAKTQRHSRKEVMGDGGTVWSGAAANQGIRFRQPPEARGED